MLISCYSMYRRSDVQKVHIVYSNQLVYIQNTIVFSMYSCYPLIEKMSNRDYDSNRYQIYQELYLVEEFKNALPPIKTLQEKLKIQTDSETLLESLDVGRIDRFLSKNFKFHFQTNVLSKCANFQKSYSYSTNIVHSLEFDCLADL